MTGSVMLQCGRGFGDLGIATIARLGLLKLSFNEAEALETSEYRHRPAHRQWGLPRFNEAEALETSEC